MEIKIPELNKKSGVCYAVTSDGVELPVIDITNPAFTVNKPAAAEMEIIIQKALQDQAKHNRLPVFLQNIMLGIMARKSVLMRGLRGSSGTFLSGMTTYLMKLGPENLGRGYAGKIDQQIGASLPAFSARLRLQDIVRVMADNAAILLAAKSKAPLHFINIAGGPCSDSLNTLILLRKEKPNLLLNREIAIHVFDLESPGPEFAKQSLAALQAESAPLAGLSASLNFVHHNWSNYQELREYLKGLQLSDAVVVVSSEGGLFNYGTDEEITENLKTFQACTPADTVLAGTITPVAGPGNTFNKMSGLITIPRSLESFKTLIAPTGWQVNASITQLMNHVVGMRKT